MKNNKKGLSLPLAMGLVIIMTLLAFAILEYIIPFSREIKGVENSSNAYYQANSGIEEGLYDVYIRNNSGSIDDTDEYGKVFSSDSITNKYDTYSSGTSLPIPGEGNSEYNKDWNIIASGNPIQLTIGEGYIDSDFEIAFRVPDLDKFESNSEIETLSGGLLLPIINWQLSGNGKTLNASGGIVKASSVLEADDFFSDNSLDIWGEDGEDLGGISQSFASFYGVNCTGILKCILKFSIINKLELDDNNVIIPYLEWKIDTGTNIIPLRYTKIESSGKSYGYKKTLDVKVAGQTVNEAYDFTVFQ